MIESAELEKFKDEKGVKPWDTELLLQLLLTGQLGIQPSALLPGSMGTDISLTGTSQEKRLRVQSFIRLQTPHLQKFPGSFACLYLIQGQGLYMFRNRIAPMFLDQSGTVCSIGFEGAAKAMPNVVYSVPSMEPMGIFDNDYDPYGMS